MIIRDLKQMHRNLAKAEKSLRNSVRDRMRYNMSQIFWPYGMAISGDPWHFCTDPDPRIHGSN